MGGVLRSKPQGRLSSSYVKSNCVNVTSTTLSAGKTTLFTGMKNVDGYVSRNSPSGVGKWPVLVDGPTLNAFSAPVFQFQ